MGGIDVTNPMNNIDLVICTGTGTICTDVQCPHCRSYLVSKRGKSKNGKKIGMCKTCGKQFIIENRQRQHFSKELLNGVKNWGEPTGGGVTWRRDMDDSVVIRRGD
jgi:hypothetical protein